MPSDAVVFLQYATLVVSDRDVPAWGRRGANGLVEVAPVGAVILTGIHTGWVRVVVDARTTPPDELPLADWDEVVEVSVVAPYGDLKVFGLMSEGDCTLPRLDALGHGTYRLRVHARGRNRYADSTPDLPAETYLIVSWPAEMRPDLAYKLTDAVGAERRAAQPAERREGTSRDGEELPPPSLAQVRQSPPPPDVLESRAGSQVATARELRAAQGWREQQARDAALRNAISRFNEPSDTPH